MLTTPSLKHLVLKDADNDLPNRGFCGPTAISSITGVPVSVAKNAVRLAKYGPKWVERHRTPKVTGVALRLASEALRLLGYEGFWAEVKGKPTLAAWSEKRERVCKDYPCLVVVSNHCVAISGHTFCDTFSKGKVVDLEDAPGRRKRVEWVYILQYRVPAQEIPARTPARLDPRKRIERNIEIRERNAFKRYLAKIGASFEHDRYDSGLIHNVMVTFADGRKLGMGEWRDWEHCLASVKAYLENPFGPAFNHEDDDEIVWTDI